MFLLKEEITDGHKKERKSEDLEADRSVLEPQLVGALSDKKLLAPMLFQGTTNSKIFNLWLENSLLPTLQKGSTLIMDNAAFHKSTDTKNLIYTAGCKLLFLHPYSPDLNPIDKYGPISKNTENITTMTI